MKKMCHLFISLKHFPAPTAGYIRKQESPNHSNYKRWWLKWGNLRWSLLILLVVHWAAAPTRKTSGNAEVLMVAALHESPTRGQRRGDRCCTWGRELLAPFLVTVLAEPRSEHSTYPHTTLNPLDPDMRRPTGSSPSAAVHTLQILWPYRGSTVVQRSRPHCKKPLEWWTPSRSVLENTVINPAENPNIIIMRGLDPDDVFLLQYIVSVIHPRYTWGGALESIYNPRKRKEGGEAPDKLKCNTGNPIKNKKAKCQWWLHQGFSWFALAMKTARKRGREEKPHCLPELLQPGSAASNSAWCTVTQPSSCEKNQKLFF